MQRVIAIDPGHGGSDPGAIGPTGLREADVNLTLARLVAEWVDKLGHKPYLTRTRDVGVGLGERARRATVAKADLFISLHCNSASDPAACGMETFHHSQASDEAKALAATIQSRVVAAGGLRNRGVKAANFAVLRETPMPAVLVEVAFISNPGEERLLRDPDWLDNIAEQIARAAVM